MPQVSDFTIQLDDLSDPVVADFLAAHLVDMRRVSPPESVHALDINGLRQPEVTFWTQWNVTDTQQTLVGTAALKALTREHAEIKSMRVHACWRGRGLA
ncbi:MAG TPA: GNAT family N-acetyltransferase, partial [Hydrogenophaga sp.]|nr:GNAT family N-acetyltransferase [Hydrogenophaga sp.]